MGSSALGGITLQANGNVGIGTTAPAYPLDIIGILRVSEAQTWLRSSASTATLYVEQSGAGPSAVFMGGDVGIGTTSPDSKLHLSTVGTDGLRLGVDSQTYYHMIRPNGDGLYIGADDGDTGGAGADIRFSVKGGEKMRISSGGNVGIGTTNPLSLLAVQDSTHGGSIQIGSSSGEDQYQYVNFANNWQIGKNNLTASSIGEPGSLYIHNLDRSTSDFCITSSGNVGIGTTSPSVSLDISGSSGMGGIKYSSGTGSDVLALDIGYTGGGSGLAVKNTNGNVGIGTTDPASKLSIHNTGTTSVDAITLGWEHLTSSAGIEQRIKWKFGDDTSENASSEAAYIAAGKESSWTVGANRDSYLSFATTKGSNTQQYGGTEPNYTAVERMRIDAAGNVGIGTTSPVDKLSIVTESSVYAAGFSATDVTVQACWSDKLATPTTYGIVIQSGGGSSTNGYLIGGWGAGSQVFKVKNNGDVFSNTNSFTSDDRVKHNEETIIGAIETLGKLTPKKYIKTTKMYDADHNFELDADGNPVDEDGELVDHCIEAGVIAQQVLTVDELSFTVSPEGVDEDGTVTSPHALNYNSLFTYAIAAIQEQQKLIEDLKSRIETLES